jgi:hypothetical protein
MAKPLIDTRSAFLRCGIDYGSDARVLLVKGLFRLVWAKASTTLIGIKGGGFARTPCTLVLREFEQEGGRISPGRSETLLSGGRLSRGRMLSVAEKIDFVFGEGTAAQLDYRQTQIVGVDVVSTWLDLQREKEEQSQRESSRALREQIEALGDNPF